MLPHRRLLLKASFGLICAPRIGLARSTIRNFGVVRRDLDGEIAQMLIMGFVGADTTSVGARAIATWLRSRLIGGVIFFEDNLPSPQQARSLTRLFRDAAAPSIPFLCVDQEGGAISRLRPERGFQPLPSAHSVSGRSPKEAERLYERTARELNRLGFNVNFGPVVDLALNRNNSVIEGLGRSYGKDPSAVIAYAKAFIRAHRRNHILTALKHFPGHGSTSTDSHRSLPVITGVWRKEELRPFAELARGGYADMIMAGHLVHDRLSGPGRPASLSAAAIQGLLRHALGYRGVVVTDDMQMGALARFGLDERILLGIEAGCDLFIYSNRLSPDRQMPWRFHRVISEAITRGRLTRARIERSAELIRHLKLCLGNERSPGAPKGSAPRLQSPNGRKHLVG
jgi:beta-N-acetylhexosaminidase